MSHDTHMNLVRVEEFECQTALTHKQEQPTHAHADTCTSQAHLETQSLERKLIHSCAILSVPGKHGLGGDT